MTDLEALRGKRIAYVPYAADLRPPGDRRRLARWAAVRDIPLEIAAPGESYDLVVLSARADISHWVRDRSGARLVYDLIDSYLEIPAWRPDDVARGLGKTVLRQHRHLTPSFTRAVEAMCRRADAVVCSTPEQRRTIARHSPDVRPILDIHDAEFRRPLPPRRPPDGELRLFWEGQPQNLSGFDQAASAALARLAETRPVSLHLATDPTYPRYFGRVGTARTERLLRRLPVPVTLHTWDVAALPDIAASCDVGVIPLDLSDGFAAAKPENKLLIMWQLGLPVVASATPAYRRTMAGAGLHDVCTTVDDWVDALSRLTDPAERAVAAERGAAYVETTHREERILEQWDELMLDLLQRPPRVPAGQR